jgi:hypothetical protein
LQIVIQKVKEADLDFPVQFVNYQWEKFKPKVIVIRKGTLWLRSNQDLIKNI